MWKMVSSDLRCGIKPGLKKVFKHITNYYFYLYLMFLAPLFLHLTGRGFLFYFFSIIPVILAMLLLAMYGEGVNKVLYLCPLSKKERRQYFLVLWGIRAGLPSLLSLLFEGMFCIFGWIPPLAAGLAVTGIILFSAAIGLYSNMQEISRTDQRLASHSIWYGAVLIVGIFGVIFLALMVGDVEEPEFSGLEITVALILFFAHAFTALKVIGKYFHPVMENLIFYEKVERAKNEEANEKAGLL